MITRKQGALCIAAMLSPLALAAAFATTARPADSLTLEILSVALEDPVAATRQAAVTFLQERIGPTPNIPEALIDKLRAFLENETDASQRMAALRIARAFGSGANGLAGLITAQLSGRGDAETIAAIEAIASLGMLNETGADAREAWSKLGALVDSDSPAVRDAAQKATGRKHSDESVSGTTGNEASPSELEIDGHIGALSEPMYRDLAINHMAEVEKVSDEQAQQLVRLLRHGDPDTRIAAVSVLGQLTGRDAQSAPYVARLLGDREPDVCKAAIGAIASMGSSGAKFSGAVVSQLKSNDPGVQIAAIDALASMNPELSAKQVLALGTHANSSVRQAVESFSTALAAEVARRQKIGMGTPQLRQQLDSRDSASRSAALAMIEELGPAGRPLAHLAAQKLSDADASVRMAAIRAVMATDTTLPDLHNELVVLREDSDDKVRGAARYAMSQLADPNVALRLPSIARTAGSASSAVTVRNAASATATQPDDLLTRRVACLELILSKAGPIGPGRLECYLLGRISEEEQLMFRFINDQPAGIFPPPARLTPTEVRSVLRAMSAIWVASIRSSSDGSRASWLRDYASRLIERIVSAHASSFGEADLPLLRTLQSQLERGGFGAEAVTLKEVAGRQPTALITSWLSQGLVGLSAYIVILAVCFYRTRWSPRAFRLLTDDGPWKILLPMGPALAITHWRPALLWVFDLFFRKRKIAIEEFPRAPYLGVPLRGPCDEAVDSSQFLATAASGIHVWIQGPSGMGKSSLFWHLIDQHYRDSTDAFDAFRRMGRLIVPVNARQYAGGEDKADAEWMLSIVKGALNRRGLSFDNKPLLRDLLLSGDIAIAIDGLNESGKSRAIQAFIDLHPTTPLIITSQDSPLPGFDHWRLPADAQALVDDLLEFYLGAEAAAPLKDSITLSGLRAGIKSGYDVRLIYEIYRDQGVTAVPSTLQALYEQILTMAWPTAVSETDVVGEKADLAAAAWLVLSNRVKSGRRDVRPSDGVSATLLQSLAATDRTRFLRQAGDAFEFVHDQMNAYLAARHLSRTDFASAPLAELIFASSVSSLPGGEQQPLWTFFAILIDDQRLDQLYLHVEQKASWETLRLCLLDEFQRRRRSVPRRNFE